MKMNTATGASSASLLLNEAQAADILNVSTRTLQQWRVAGRGPRFARLGRAVRYRQSDLESFVEAGVVSSTAEADLKAGAR